VTAAALLVVAGAALDRIVWRNGTGNAPLARRVRWAFERLGPTFVKAGQLMSSSPGSLPKTWVDEMAHCRDDVPAASWKSVSQLLADELGARRGRLVHIDPKPVAAGSIAQVHTAELDDGLVVVVKVQRPGLEKVLAGDIRLLRIAARLAARLSPACAAANPVRLVDDFAGGLYGQLSFRREAANARLMQHALASLPVRVPKVISDLSTDRVLVMERLEGVAGSDLGAIDALGVDRSELVRTVVAALILPALRAGAFHGDMHAGNMVVMADGGLGLVDFGVVGHLDPATRAAASDILDAAVHHRFGDVAMAVCKMVDATDVDLAAVIPEVAAFMAAHLDTTVAALDVRQALSGILQLAARHGFTLPESLVAFFKQMLYIDGICRELDPGFDVLGDVAPIVAMARDQHHPEARALSTIAA
jgi:ubiquinone biosynthesis protein